jgi:pyridoxal phosphate enzyme (YggS family)
MGESGPLSQIRDNFERVSGIIADTAAGRPVQLICVTKYAQLPWIEDLLVAGATHLAENRLPDAADRFAELRAQGRQFTAHLIGPQQSRKIRQIPGHFDWFQALDSQKAAAELAKRIEGEERKLDVLLQVNIAEEPQKHGVEPDAADETFGRILEEYPAVSLRGIMAIPPWPAAYSGAADFECGTRGYFRQMKALFDRISSHYRGRACVDTLSLGMSQDYVWAIEEGATMVRVGSALFDGLEG